MSLWVAACIALAAVTYLFDFGSNIVVVLEFGRRYSKFFRLEHHGDCSPLCRHQTSELTGYFWAMTGVLVLSHTLNAIIFNFKFKKKDVPCRAAYFLPLIHLWRLVKLLWRTFSLKGVQDLRSDEMNGLYNILGASYEGVPLLIIQFCAYLVLIRVGLYMNNMPVVFKVSVAASLLSAAYNGGTSVQSVTENAKTFKEKAEVAIAAGLFTLFATINRCLSYANILVWMREHFWKDRSERSRAKFHFSDVIPPFFLTLSISGYWLFYWLVQFPKVFSKRLHDPKRCLASLTFGYMSVFGGPLYPMASEAKDNGELGRRSFHFRLILVVLVNVLADIVVMLATYLLRALPMPYMLASLVAAVGYLVSIGWYIGVDRQISGSSRVRKELEGRDVENQDMHVVGCGVVIPAAATIVGDSDSESNDARLVVLPLSCKAEPKEDETCLQRTDANVKSKTAEGQWENHQSTENIYIDKRSAEGHGECHKSNETAGDMICSGSQSDADVKSKSDAEEHGDSGEESENSSLNGTRKVDDERLIEVGEGNRKTIED